MSIFGTTGWQNAGLPIWKTLIKFWGFSSRWKKSISTNLFGLFPIFYKDEATQYAFMSLGFNGSFLLK